MCEVSSEGLNTLQGMHPESLALSIPWLSPCSSDATTHRHNSYGSRTRKLKVFRSSLTQARMRRNSTASNSKWQPLPICLVIWKPIPEPPPVTSATFPLRQSVRNGDCSAEELIVQRSTQQGVQSKVKVLHRDRVGYTPPGSSLVPPGACIADRHRARVYWVCELKGATQQHDGCLTRTSPGRY